MKLELKIAEALGAMLGKDIPECSNIKNHPVMNDYYILYDGYGYANMNNTIRNIKNLIEELLMNDQPETVLVDILNEKHKVKKPVDTSISVC